MLLEKTDIHLTALPLESISLNSSLFYIEDMTKDKTDEKQLTEFIVPGVGIVEAKDFDDLAKKLKQIEKEDGDGNDK